MVLAEETQLTSEKSLIQELKLEELKTPEDYLLFARQKVTTNLLSLNEKTDWFGKDKSQALKEVERIGSHMDQIFNLFQAGGEFGDKSFLANKLEVHNIKHVLLQVALASDVASTLALMPESERPQANTTQSREFRLAQWQAQVYTALLHETGYLRYENETETLEKGLVTVHEERGTEFAALASKVWGLANGGIDVEQIKQNILATKMSGQHPQHFENLSGLSFSDIAHLTDLLSYFVSPTYIPDGTIALWWEYQGFSGSKFIATRKRATGSPTSYIVDGFSLRGKAGENWRWGEGPGCLLELLTKQARLPMIAWQRQHETMLKDLALIEKIFTCPKQFDCFQVEGSANSAKVVELAGKYLGEESPAFQSLVQERLEKIVNQQLAKGKGIFERLPTAFLRDISQAIDGQKKQEAFLTDLLTAEMTESAEQKTQEMLVKIAPLAWQFERGRGKGITWPVDFAVRSFVQAREIFLRSELGINYSAEKIRMAVTLRREDGWQLNQALIKQLKGIKDIDQIEIAGDETSLNWDRKDTIDTINLIRLINSELKAENPKLEISWNLGQLPRGKEKLKRNVPYRPLEHWYKVKEVDGVDILLYPTRLLTDEEFKQEVLAQQSITVFLPVNEILQLGYNWQDLIGFIRGFPKSRIRLTSMNSSVDGSLTIQIYQLKKAGLTNQELQELGIQLE
ncbi:hypothetical protein A2160_00975 [Candidatus Beckwithbacteria bacterium RBG_13_42_9]|uniref:Uncharacterized protein n=1 Tax=Candidatus Beckwithbacteria bacterium RBG_13_42_9 TaxID=1797457 RepID=A0A1F5E3B3_9BACT|nr:MAG: hypothetical protein A2160_00975 [Candidatus Beckwithbacteria bacterium RBG_13_42_9]